MCKNIDTLGTTQRLKTEAQQPSDLISCLENNTFVMSQEAREGPTKHQQEAKLSI